jgi:hypothetical protein
MVQENKKRTRPKTDTPSPQNQRFLQLLHLCRLTEKQFRTKYGVVPRHVWNWFNRDKGEIPDTPESWGVIERAAREAGVAGLTLDWLNHGVGDGPYLTSLKDTSTRPISDVAELPGKVPDGLVRVLCLEEFSLQHTRYIDIPSSLLRNNLRLLEPHVRVVENVGEAMRGEIEDGDLCFVDTRVNAFDEEAIYACHMGRLAVIRRIVKGSRGLRLQSAKPSEDSFDVLEGEQKSLRIRGRVIYVLGGKSLKNRN